MFELKTDRLIIRDLRSSDWAFIVELLNDPAFIENIGDRNIRTKEHAEKYIRDSIIASYITHGFGLYLIEIHPNIPIGLSGVLKRPELSYPDVGFAFLSNFRNKGYAFESSKAIMKHVINKFDLKNMLGITKESNQASRLLLEKLGLTLLKKINFKGSDDTLLYGLTPLNH